MAPNWRPGEGRPRPSSAFLGRMVQTVESHKRRVEAQEMIAAREAERALIASLERRRTREVDVEVEVEACGHTKPAGTILEGNTGSPPSSSPPSRHKEEKEEEKAETSPGRDRSGPVGPSDPTVDLDGGRRQRSRTGGRPGRERRGLDGEDGRVGARLFGRMLAQTVRSYQGEEMLGEAVGVLRHDRVTSMALEPKGVGDVPRPRGRGVPQYRPDVRLEDRDHQRAASRSRSRSRSRSPPLRSGRYT